jgi:hypothetical protein
LNEAVALFRLRRKSVKKRKEGALKNFPCLTTNGRSLENFSERNRFLAFYSSAAALFGYFFQL